MKRLPDCPNPQDIEEWQAETSDIDPMPVTDEKPQVPLIINPITPSHNAKGLYNHNSFSHLMVGDTANIDRNLAEKFTSGKLKIEARLDLHGLTEKQAFEQVRDFISSAYTQGKRCVLIITGKGSTNDIWWETKGVIRQSFSQWLNHIEIRPYLLAATQATPHDGGAGAFYCLLKRQRQ